MRAHLHVGRDVAEHRRREHAVLADLAAREDLGAAGDRFVDPRLHAVALAGGDQRRHVGAFVERVADDEPFDQRHERVEERSRTDSCT